VSFRAGPYKDAERFCIFRQSREAKQQQQGTTNYNLFHDASGELNPANPVFPENRVTERQE
jgi:hypothetical protein